jgi:WD40 repeat protein
LLSVTCAPIHGLAQTKEPDKRGVGVPAGPAQPTANTRPILSDRPELILQTGHTQSVNAVTFSPDNRWLASGGKDNVIKIWDLTNGNVLRTLYGHSSNINALAVSEDGKLLASGSGNVKDDRDLGIFVKGGVVGGEDNTVRIWNVQTGRELQVLRCLLVP